MDIRHLRGAEPTRTGSSSFWKYWTASVTSTTGAGVTSVALPLVALMALDVSNFEMGLLTAAGYAAVVLVGLPAGVIVRRYPLRSLQVSMDAFRAVAMLSIPLAAWWGVLTVAQLLLVAFLVGMAGSIFDVANATFLPRIVSRDELIARNGMISSSLATTSLVGPALGGLLVQFVGPALSIVIDAVTYVVSAVMLGRIRSTDIPEPVTERIPFLGQVAAGLRYVFAHPVIRPSVVAATAVNFANGCVFAVTAPFLVRSLGVAPGAVGVVLAVDGVGSIVGAALTARLAARIGTARALLLATSVGGALALAMPLASGGWALALFATGMAGFAAGVAVLSVVTRTHRQAVSPPHLLSRVMASVRFVSWSAIPVGSLVAGAVAEVWSPRVGLVVAGAAALLAPVAVWSSRVRTLRELADADPAPADPPVV